MANLTGQITDEDKCVELMAHGMLAPSYGQNMAALEVLQQKIDNLKKNYYPRLNNYGQTYKKRYTLLRNPYHHHLGYGNCRFLFS